jgi:hypothetical protein
MRRSLRDCANEACSAMDRTPSGAGFPVAAHAFASSNGTDIHASRFQFIVVILREIELARRSRPHTGWVAVLAIRGLGQKFRGARSGR